MNRISLHGNLIRLVVEEFINEKLNELSSLETTLKNIFKFDISVSYDSSNEGYHTIRIQFINYDGRENELTVTVMKTLSVGSIKETHL